MPPSLPYGCAKAFFFGLVLLSVVLPIRDVFARDILFEPNAAQLRYLLSDSELHVVEEGSNCLYGGDDNWLVEYRPDGTFAFESYCVYNNVEDEYEIGEGKWEPTDTGVCMVSDHPFVLDKRTCWRIVLTGFGFERLAPDDGYRATLKVVNENHPASRTKLLEAMNRYETEVEPAALVASRAEPIARKTPPTPVSAETDRAEPIVRKTPPTPAETDRAEPTVPKPSTVVAPRPVPPAASPQIVLRAWEKARQLDDFGSYERFLSEHGNSEFEALAKARVATLTKLKTARTLAAIDHWERIEQSDKAVRFEMFLKLYPESDFAELARARLAALNEGKALVIDREQQRWATASASTDVAAVQAYLDDFPKGRFADDARLRLHHLNKVALVRDIPFGRYYALVIGNQAYTHLPQLRTAVNDADAVAETLRSDYGFDVRHLKDATRGDIINALDELAEVLGPDDNLLIYYAGHGWLDKNADRGYWLPVDAKPNRRARWLSNATVTDSLKLIQAKHVMVVADSCYSGTLTRSVRGAGPQRHGYFREMAARRARVALVSGGLEPVSDGSGTHSPFARALIHALGENDSVIDGATLYAKLRRPVILEADQTPEYSDVREAGHDGGDFLFVRADLRATR